MHVLKSMGVMEAPIKDLSYKEVSNQFFYLIITLEMHKIMGFLRKFKRKFN